jgi:sialic acid synthase SpsE
VTSVKIAARDWCYPLIRQIPDSVEIFCSVTSWLKAVELRTAYDTKNIHYLCCVAEYPAQLYEYVSRFVNHLHFGISDHTPGIMLYDICQPMVYEKHVCSYHDENIPDRSSYACTMREIGGIL